MTLGPLRGQIDYDPETFDDPDPELIAVMTEGSIAAISESGFRSLPLPAEHAAGIDDVEGLGHQDPFDRVLLSQARVEGLDFYTWDREILAAGLPFVRDARS